MLVKSLESHGVPADILAAWQAHVGDQLLPVQDRAVQEGLFHGKDLIVFAPTSSGKTFVGEMAAARAARADKKVFYLVPLKALAEEKYREFRERYAGLDIKVVISTRDRRDDDGDIEAGRFHIAIVVFEKLQSLLVSRPELLQKIGLVVVDELQTIADDQRGPDLEILLTKIRRTRNRPQFLGLSAVLGNAQPLADWLGATLLVDQTRPVELRKGVLCRGTFTYREHNGGAVAKEEIGTIETKDPREHLVGAVTALAAGEQVLVFVPDRPTSRAHAELLAERLALPGAAAAAEELRATEDGLATQALARTLAHGVAFHNSDLTPEQREVVERHFRSGAIRVVVATSTLAMGVNLPVRNVVITERWKWRHSRLYEKWIRDDLAPSEFDNMAGRAGRLRFTAEFGRAMLLATSKWDADVWMRVLVGAPLTEVAPTLVDRPLTDIVLNLLASHLCRDEKGLGGFLLDSFTGCAHWGPALGREAFEKALHDAVEELVECRVVTRTARGKLEVAPVGKIAARRGLSARSAATLARWADKAREATFTPLEVFLVASLTPEAQDIYMSLSTPELRYGDYYNRFLAAADRIGATGRPVMQWVRREVGRLSYDQLKGLKKALLLYEWVEERKTDLLEKDHNVWAGAINHCALDFAWLIEALAEIAEGQAWSPERVHMLRELTERLRHGVKPELLPLARVAAAVPGVGRSYLRRLAEAGITTPELLAAAEQDKLASALRHRGLAAKLRAAVAADGRLAAGAPAEVRGDEPSETDRRVDRSPSERPKEAIADVVPVVAPIEVPAEPPVAMAAEAVASYGAAAVPERPVLIVDLPRRQVLCHGKKIPTRAPNHLQRQPLLALAVLAQKPGEIFTMQELAEGLKRLGGFRKRPVAPDARDLRYKIIRPLKKALLGDLSREEVDLLVESMPGEGLRLNVPASAVVLVSAPARRAA